MQRTLIWVVLLTGLLARLAAQGVYDDFNATGPLDQKRWYYEGQNTSKQGVFEVRVPANQSAADLESTYGFDGDFDLQLDYQNLNGPGSFWLGIYDANPKVPDSDIWLGLRPGPAGLMVEGGGNVVRYHSSVPVANMSAGSLRISRAVGAGGVKVISLSYRFGAATIWTPLFQELDSLGPVVMLWVEVSGGAQAFSVDFDVLKSTGKNLHYPAAPKPAPYSFGSSCHDFHARAVGFPFVNTPTDFVLAAWGTSPGAVVHTVIGQSGSIWLGLPLPFALGPLGFPACFLHVPAEISATSGIADKDGEWSFPLPVPNVSALRGLKLSSQAIAVDLNAPIGSQVATSEGSTFTIL